MWARAVGVGHFVAASVNVVPVCRVAVPYSGRFRELSQSFAVVVGQDEHALPPMRRANVSCSKDDRRRDAVTQAL